MQKFYAMTTLLLCAVGACGGDDPITAIDRTTDCSSICNKYKDCIDGDYDVDACESDCTDMVSEEETSDIDMCKDCVDDNSCVDSVFSCTDECAGIVP